MHRRDLLRAAAAIPPSLSALQGLALLTTSGMGCARADETSAAGGGYAPPVPRPARNTGEILLEVPDGFEYTVFSRTGDPLSDGRLTPSSHDGMAAFQVGGEVRLVRNHEVRSPIAPGRAIAATGPHYDAHAPGGTTTLVVDPETRELRRSWISLSGTSTNCAGGPTPWGSWITCEETVADESHGLTRAHGYCFEVPAAADGPVEPVPLRAMGRFVHEAIAVDPATGIVYLTEDQGAAGLYRFIPEQAGQLARGGRLQMLALTDYPGADTRRGQTPFEARAVSWVDIPDPDPREGFAIDSVRRQGVEQGAAVFGRLEGAWHGNGRIYVNSTSGGDARMGQVWEYTPGADGGSIRLLFESAGREQLGNPDNLCVSPRGRGLVLCEDGEGVQRLHGLTTEGNVFEFARNAVPGYETMEFAGATFAPDGRTLFVNIQTPGLTLAIWGPWEQGAL